ncbi:hypothetical protein GQ42DRAFT_151769 [Ramicandelaber brevisporus]|nr:hypothetical protein GQ42DRAFT_151769 [Ramicandelaber brevisporus]
MGLYAFWGVAQGFTQFFNNAVLAIAGVVASKTMHRLAIRSILRAPVSFFDTTPIGRIINRFSKDHDALDNTLTDAIRMFLATLASVVSTFIFIGVIMPVFFAVLVPLLVVYWFAAQFYRSTSREIKRLDSITRSPLFAHFSETLMGLSTVRAYRVQDQFVRTNERLLDDNNRAYYLLISIQRWLGVRLETISNLLTFFATLFAIVNRNTIDPGIVGIVMTYSLSVTGMFSWCVRQFAEVEMAMNSVERIDVYCTQLEAEAPAVIADNRPAAAWPSAGAIEIKDLDMRYRDGLPLVLKSLNVSIKAGERIGICGRTGSGKSSLMVALFRIVEAAGGSIHIDGTDISTIGLADLRSKLAIIPQEATLFHGSFRSNLDPFGRHDDAALWSALERADLKTYVSALPKQLDDEIAEGGENLSAGQRQLLCLARALLTNASIVVLDEATASVDVQTDELLQVALRRDFEGCTILAIAHRLNTIIDYDRILVLENGMLKEFDSPGKLLDDPASEFSRLVDETGPANAAYLRSVARK